MMPYSQHQLTHIHLPPRQIKRLLVIIENQCLFNLECFPGTGKWIAQELSLVCVCVYVHAHI